MSAEQNPILKEIAQVELQTPLRESTGPSPAELRNEQKRAKYYDHCAALLLAACQELVAFLAEKRKVLPDTYGERSILIIRSKCAAIRDVFAVLSKGKRHEFGPFVQSNPALRTDLVVVHSSSLKAVTYFDETTKRPKYYRRSVAEDKLYLIIIALDDVKSHCKPSTAT